MAVFAGQGFETIVPDILQPADVFLDRSGENIRSRTFVFTDPSGAELCLRPDLTVPTCRFHLSHQSDPRAEARYCYCGPAFRFQPGGADQLHPSEFDQAGVEWFGASDAELAEAEVLAMTVRAVEAAGLRRYTIRLGDLGLFECAAAVARHARAVAAAAQPSILAAEAIPRLARSADRRGGAAADVALAD